MALVYIPTTALVVTEPWVSLILNGAKTWELHSFSTHKRERIGLIAKGSGTIIGTVDIIDSFGPLTHAELDASERHHRAPAELRRDHPGWQFAWVLRSPKSLSMPVPYSHPAGAQTFVTLDPVTQLRLHRIITGKRFSAEAFQRKIE